MLIRVIKGLHSLASQTVRLGRTLWILEANVTRNLRTSQSSAEQTPTRSRLGAGGPSVVLLRETNASGYRQDDAVYIAIMCDCVAVNLRSDHFLRR
jgi:hypothetical protein